MGRKHEDDYVTYTLVTTPATNDAPAETAKLKIKKFRGGSARDWLRWSGQFRTLARKKGWSDEQKAHNLVALIEGDLETEVEVAARDAVNGGQSFEQFFTSVGLLSVPPYFSEDLDNELWTMTKRRDETVLKFSQRLKDNVRMFAELPEDAEDVPEVQQCRYFKRGMPRAWQNKLAAAGVVHDRLNELVLYFTRIEKAEQRLATHDKGRRNNDSGRNDSSGRNNSSGWNNAYRKETQKPQHRGDKKKDQGSNRPDKQDRWCSFHKTGSHNTSDCHALKNKGKAEHKRVEAKPKRAREAKPRYPRIHNDSQSDSDSDASAESSSEDEELKFVGLVEKKPRPASAPLRITVKLRRSGEKFEALLDSGASKSIINRETLAANVQSGRKFIPASPIVFDTMNGSVTSSGSTVAQFVFAQLKSETVITHRFEVIEDSSDAMVIGRDLMNSLGLILNFKDKVVHWEDCSLSLNTGHGAVALDADEQQGSEFPEESKEAGDNAVEPEQLLPEQLDGELAQQYLALLVKHRDRYDGHLGRMRFPDYELPLSPDYKPVHAKPYAIPRSIEDKAKASIQRLINEDVMEQIYDSEMESPAFFLVKPDGSLRLLIDYRWLNQYLKWSPYYVPRIRDVLMRLVKAKCISTFDANLENTRMSSR